MREVIVTKEPVELYKILKFEGMVGSGGEAKAAVAEGQVQVNGKVETQKRKQIVSGDVITFGTEQVVIKLKLD
ncbi:MAG: RNA-binding S4 domain-containing protein [Thiobacillus sp.]|nr:RNA-binding S4 domain-containing protein [Thiobacillus sp.]